MKLQGKDGRRKKIQEEARSFWDKIEKLQGYKKSSFHEKKSVIYSNVVLKTT